MARILITGGRAPVCLDLARHFWGQGHSVFIAESQSAQVSRTSFAVRKTFSVPPPRQQCEAFLERLHAIIREEQIDVLIATCEEVFYVSQGKSRFPSTCQVWVDDFEKLRQLHDKWEFNQTAGKQGLTTPASHLINTRQDLERYRELPGQWILKPTYSRFGHRIYQGDMAELLNSRLDFTAGQTWVLQQFVEGPEYCAYGVADKGELRALSIYSHEFVAGRAGICFQEMDIPEIENNIRDFVGSIKYTGQIAFDFIISEGKAYALECNPRSTSGIHLLARRKEFGRIFLPQANAPAAGTLRPVIGSQAMVLMAMMSFALPQINSLGRFFKWLKILLTSHEVVFSWRDPLPFFDQLICIVQLALQSRRQQLDLLSMSTIDIEWNGDT